MTHLEMLMNARRASWHDSHSHGGLMDHRALIEYLPIQNDVYEQIAMGKNQSKHVVLGELESPTKRWNPQKKSMESAAYRTGTKSKPTEADLIDMRKVRFSITDGIEKNTKKIANHLRRYSEGSQNIPFRMNHVSNRLEDFNFQSNDLASRNLLYDDNHHVPQPSQPHSDIYSKVDALALSDAYCMAMSNNAKACSAALTHENGTFSMESSVLLDSPAENMNNHSSINGEKPLGHPKLNFSSDEDALQEQIRRKFRAKTIEGGHTNILMCKEHNPSTAMRHISPFGSTREMLRNSMYSNAHDAFDPLESPGRNFLHNENAALYSKKKPKCQYEMMQSYPSPNHTTVSHTVSNHNTFSTLNPNTPSNSSSAQNTNVGVALINNTRRNSRMGIRNPAMAYSTPLKNNTVIKINGNSTASANVNSKANNCTLSSSNTNKYLLQEEAEAAALASANEVEPKIAQNSAKITSRFLCRFIQQQKDSIFNSDVARKTQLGNTRASSNELRLPKELQYDRETGRNKESNVIPTTESKLKLGPKNIFSTIKNSLHPKDTQVKTERVEKDCVGPMKQINPASNINVKGTNNLAYDLEFGGMYFKLNKKLSLKCHCQFDVWEAEAIGIADHRLANVVLRACQHEFPLDYIQQNHCYEDLLNALPNEEQQPDKDTIRAKIPNCDSTEPQLNGNKSAQTSETNDASDAYEKIRDSVQLTSVHMKLLGIGAKFALKLFIMDTNDTSKLKYKTHSVLQEGQQLKSLCEQLWSKLAAQTLSSTCIIQCPMYNRRYELVSTMDADKNSMLKMPSKYIQRSNLSQQQKLILLQLQQDPLPHHPELYLQQLDTELNYIRNKPLPIPRFYWTGRGHMADGRKVLGVAMEKIEGRTLTQILQQMRVPARPSAGLLILEICIKFVQSQRILACDLHKPIINWDTKPGNVLVELSKSDTNAETLHCTRCVIIDLGDALPGPVFYFPTRHQHGVSPSYVICTKGSCSPECAILVFLLAAGSKSDAFRRTWYGDTDPQTMILTKKYRFQHRWQKLVEKGFLRRKVVLKNDTSTSYWEVRFSEASVVFSTGLVIAQLLGGPNLLHVVNKNEILVLDMLCEWGSDSTLNMFSKKSNIGPSHLLPKSGIFSQDPWLPLVTELLNNTLAFVPSDRWNFMQLEKFLIRMHSHFRKYYSQSTDTCFDSSCDFKIQDPKVPSQLLK